VQSRQPLYFVAYLLSGLLCLGGSGAQPSEDPKFHKTSLTLNSAPEMRGGDRITNVHECTHGVNSKLRQRHGGTGKVNCFFVMDGKYTVFKEPRRITLQQIATQVRKRGSCYNLYLIQQGRWWNNEPLYLFDEWVAYTNGTVVAWQVNFRGHDSTLEFALEFAHYCATLVKMLPASYAERDELIRFFLWNAKRLDAIAYQSETTGRMKRPNNAAWRLEMHAAAGRLRKLLTSDKEG